MYYYFFRGRLLEDVSRPYAIRVTVGHGVALLCLELGRLATRPTPPLTAYPFRPRPSYAVAEGLVQVSLTTHTTYAAEEPAESSDARDGDTAD